jgi:hypothetical protein
MDDLEAHVYSTRTVTLVNGALSVRIDAMWDGTVRVRVTNVGTGETFELVRSHDDQVDDLEILQRALRDAESDADDLND